jgi:hypothetical protein
VLPRGGVVDDYFSEKVADPRRWLEDINCQDAGLGAAQNKLADLDWIGERAGNLPLPDIS